MSKKIFFPLLLSAVLISFSSFAQSTLSTPTIHIIPEPVSVTPETGTFWLNNKTRFVINNDSLNDPAYLFSEDINKATGYDIPVIHGKSKRGKDIYLSLNAAPDSILGYEGYHLTVSPDKVTISANNAAGVFYGLQTLLQLLPADIESSTPIAQTNWSVPCVKITDYPRFGWRGLMLDVSRHFFDKKEVEEYINEMVKYKYNVFHWHLSDDEGWRIEIKGLPQLTKVGACRVPREGDWGNFAPPQPGEAATDCGYYTQEDVKEIVKYAQDRFVTILPEIDVPAHSLALIASYPNLSCTQLPYAVNPGSPFYFWEDNVLCTANDSTYMILDKIFTQIAQLFPGPYIHVGGDEAFKGFWAKDPRDQEVMKENNLQNLDQLQSYFEKKIEKIIISKGKKMIGWDEILQGGLAPEAAVMSWRGIQGGIAAAKMGHDVVMTPSDYTYLDLYQGDPLVEPKTYSMLRLDTCYGFNPVPPGVDPKYILGGQGNLWSEHVPNMRQAEYMTWPRALALSEDFWSPQDKKNWPDFFHRMEAEFPRLDAEHIKYAMSEYQPVITPIRDSITAELEVKLNNQLSSLHIYYSFDGTDPDNFYPEYKGVPLTFPKGAIELRVITYEGDHPMGQEIIISKKELEDRLRDF
jgi:hexosaminidase